jgi:hypothetical protein
MGGILLDKFRRLRLLPVLAEITGKGATVGAEGENGGAGKKMKERFFLDGVDTCAGSEGVDQEAKFPPIVKADAANAGEVFGDFAVPPTGSAGG